MESENECGIICRSVALMEKQIIETITIITPSY